MIITNQNESRNGLAPSTLTSSLTSHSGHCKESTPRDILSAITSVNSLIKHEKKIISVLNDVAKCVGATPERNHQARNLTVYGRHSQIAPKICSLEEQKGSTFDRLVYLLDRYLDFCRSVELVAWPIDHFKVSIWLQHDVISAIKNSRMKPLKKTVRCYVTTLESCRVKSSQLFAHSHTGGHLMQSPLIQEILQGLPCERDNLEQRLGILPESVTDNHTPKVSETERDRVLTWIRNDSGDDKAEEAMTIVTTARARDLDAYAADSPPTTPQKMTKRKYKPDPHLHTLKRYRNFCLINKIPCWPIESVRVSLWFRESVLPGGARPKDKSTGIKKTGVSLRTVQVYCSRLEYARLKVERLFQSHVSANISLYKSPEIIQILHVLSSNPDQVDLQSLQPTPVLSASSVDKDCSSEPEHSSVIKPISDHIQIPQLSNSFGPQALRHQNHKRKFDEENYREDRTPLTPPRKQARSEQVFVKQEDFHYMDSGYEEHEQRFHLNHFRRIRSIRGRKTPPPSIRTDRREMSHLTLHSPVTPSGPTLKGVEIPSISEWSAPPKSPSPVKKGCLAFILCAEEDSDMSSDGRSVQTGFSPISSPSRLSAQSTEFTLSPHSLTWSPRTRPWPPYAVSDVRNS
ncbi:hypothetical protein CROQUDRAFT_107296 [Cronartium quercuum f. sp. fusiforme G11]|uniref:Uncharacterized protein n=1 Tax=Cronartium quercuum f. sp. fusiforme G11 TaxID=708437 RepID=A0A9P6NLF8_9BASI|nr:hypothetical protein CROQUDRAFT_107296 [Cronartium quercuum f. sp. fusiforme G11]